jgi:hypothetical protein
MEINFLADQQTTELYNDTMDDHPVQTEEQIASILEEFNSPNWSELAKLLKTWGVPYWGWRKFQDIYRDMLTADRAKVVERVKTLTEYRVPLGEKSEVSTVVKLGDCIEAMQKEL